MDKQQAIQHIIKDFAGRANVRDMCLSVLDYLCEQPEENLTHISFGDIGRAAGASNPKDVIAVCQYLCGAVVTVLDLNFAFDDGDSIYPLSHNDVRQARKTGVFQHPGTGEVVDEFEEKILMYLSISDKGLTLRQLNNQGLERNQALS